MSCHVSPEPMITPTPHFNPKMRDVQRTPAPILGKIEGSHQLEKLKN